MSYITGFFDGHMKVRVGKALGVFALLFSAIALFFSGLAFAAADYVSVPAQIEAEEYAAENGIRLYTDNEGAGFVGSTEDGDYTDYGVDILETGFYKVEARVAGKSNTATVHFIVDDEEVGSMLVTPTGGWETWKTVSTTLELPAGEQDLRLLYSGSGRGLMNIDWFTIGELEDNPESPVDPSKNDGWTRCATENETCDFSGTTEVGYGHGVNWNFETATDGIECNNRTFGDPKRGTRKACYYLGATESEPEPPAPEPEPEPPAPEPEPEPPAPEPEPEPPAPEPEPPAPEPEPGMPEVGLHPDIVKVIDVTGDNPRGAGWADSYSVGSTCFISSTNFDHGIGEEVVDTPQGRMTIEELAGKLDDGPGRGDNPLYNDIQCGNGPANDAVDETNCPGLVEYGPEGCGHIGPKWDLSELE